MVRETMPLSTSEQRVDALIALSDRIYPAIDQVINDETRARRMLRLGIRVVAHTLEETFGVGMAGNRWHGLFVQELERAGLSIDNPVYDLFPAYRTIVNKLPKNIVIPPADHTLDELTNTYADVKRATWAHDMSYETDASHVTHLAGLALPYAAEHYPFLDLRKVAVYILIHDIVEAYVGDTPSFGLSDDAMAEKAVLEAEAMGQLEHEHGTKYPKLVKLVHDYENLVDNEARYVKTFDKLDPGFTHLANGAHQLVALYNITSQQDHLDSVQLTTNRMQAYSSTFPSVMHDRNELVHRVGLAAWPETMDLPPK